MQWLRGYNGRLYPHEFTKVALNMDSQSFEQHKKALQAKIVELSGSIVSHYVELVSALEEVDGERLKRLGEQSGAIKQMADDLDSIIISAIPEIELLPENLHRMIAFLKISNKLAKAYDIAKKFGKRVSPMLDKDFAGLKIYKDMLELARSSLKTLEIAHQVCLNEGVFDLDTTLSRAIAEESRSDDLFSMIHKDIIISNYKEEVYVKASIELFNAGRRLERAADVALDIVRLVCYIRTGKEG